MGGNIPVSISFSPPSSVQEGVYSLALRVTSGVYATTDIPIFVSLTLSGQGNMVFKVADVFTGTLDANNNTIQGLAGALITMQNQDVSTVSATLTTDSAGEADFENLPSGNYKYAVSSNKHSDATGVVWVKPGITGNQYVFMEYNAVTISWSVQETTIADTYDVVLSATYETDVPVAVLVVEPASVTLPAMKAGDVFTGQLNLTNYGLILGRQRDRHHARGGLLLPVRADAGAAGVSRRGAKGYVFLSHYLPAIPGH